MKEYSDDFLRRLGEGDPSLKLPAPLPPPRRKRFVAALRIEDEAAREANMLGFQSRLLVQCSLPYRRQLVNEWTRHNGATTLTLWAPKDIGLPYGVYPRLLLIWVVTEAVRTQSRRIELHDSLNKFIAQLGISSHANGEKTRRFKEQTRRLFSTTIASTLIENTEKGTVVHDTGLRLANEIHLWWDTYRASQPFETLSYLVLSEDFYRTITDRPVPVDLRGIQAVKGSALALDIYSWLVYRMSYLKALTQIPWDLLRWQFGGEYAPTKERRYGFKRDFTAQLHAVLQVYTNARVEIDKHGITLRPSPLHIPRK